MGSVLGIFGKPGATRVEVTHLKIPSEPFGPSIAGLLLIATAAWFAASWIDTGNDSTCGAAVYPGMWLGGDAPEACRTTMAIRWSISATAGIVGAGLLYIAAVARRPVPRARLILGIAVATSIALLVINEAVRSDGALSHGTGFG